MTPSRVSPSGAEYGGAAPGPVPPTNVFTNILEHIAGLRYNSIVGKYTYQLVDAGADLEGAFAVRRAVFVAEQGVDRDIECTLFDTII